MGLTNGCFDLLHPGHVELLKRSRAACDRLVVALNDDASVRRLKGETRPVQNEHARSIVMAAIDSVDLVTLLMRTRRCDLSVCSSPTTSSRARTTRSQPSLARIWSALTEERSFWFRSKGGTAQLRLSRALAPGRYDVDRQRIELLIWLGASPPNALVSPRRPIGKSNARAAGRDFRSEIERQLLEIQDAFCAFVDDAERQKQDTEGRLREAEQQKKDTEDRLRTIERQKQDVEDQLREAAWQLRKLQKTLPVRIVRFFRRLKSVAISAETTPVTLEARSRKTDWLSIKLASRHR